MTMEVQLTTTILKRQLGNCEGDDRGLANQAFDPSENSHFVVIQGCGHGVCPSEEDESNTADHGYPTTSHNQPRERDPPMMAQTKMVGVGLTGDQPVSYPQRKRSVFNDVGKRFMRTQVTYLLFIPF